jgi:RNA polymerase sigma-70 factor (ECF subfamily)
MSQQGHQAVDQRCVCADVEEVVSAARTPVAAGIDSCAESVDSASDEALMLRYRERLEADAFAELMRRRSPELLRHLQRMAGAAAAEDLLQQTFLHVHQHRLAYEPQRPVRPWLFSIATHLAIDWLRRGKRRRAVSLDQSLDSDRTSDAPHALAEYIGSPALPANNPALAAEAEEGTRLALGDLPERLRAPIELIYLQGRTYAEAAASLGIPVGTVRSRVHRGIERLRKASRLEKLRRRAVPAG